MARTEIPHADLAAAIHADPGSFLPLAIKSLETHKEHRVQMCRLLCGHVMDVIQQDHPAAFKTATIEDILTIAALVERTRS